MSRKPADAGQAAAADGRLHLPDSVSSAQDLQALILELHRYATWSDHESIKKRVEVDNPSEQPALTPAAQQILRTWPDGDARSLIEALEDFRAAAPSLTIVLAAPPTGGVKKTLVAWCRQNIAPGVLVSFEFNATILGGMVVRNGSRIYDWSFRRQILQNRANIPEFLR